MSASRQLNMEDVRAKLNGKRGQEYWRCLEEVAETPEFLEMLHREFPDGASEWDSALSRRNFLRLAAVSVVLAGATACTKQPVHKILPYVKQPEEMVFGKPLYYATTMPMGGYGIPVIAKNREGHPIKLDGNPDHPASRGRSDIWIQASILDLYDPDRTQSVMNMGEVSDWSRVIALVNELGNEHRADQGEGLRFLSESITSPTLVGQLEQLLKRFPKARLCQFDAICRDNVLEGAKLAFGEMVETHYQFDKAQVILSLDADFLYTHPDRLRYTRDFTDGRRVSDGKKEMNRLYAIESTPTITGSMAEHRLPVESSKVGELAAEIVRLIQGGSEQDANALHAKWITALVADLKKHRGESVVVAGDWQPPQVHAMAHWLNHQLGNDGKTVKYAKPAVFQPGNQIEELKRLSHELESGSVKTLFILGGNPVYNAPSDFKFDEVLQKAKRSIYIGVDNNETAGLCTWVIPQAHYLESWGDARSFDGTVSIQQPLIAPVYGGKTVYELFGILFQQQPIRADYEVVRGHWQKQKRWGNGFEEGWRRTLNDGFMADTREGEQHPNLRWTPEQVRSDHGDETQLEVVFRPDPSVWDGSFANNGWLQECAKPLSKIVWGNAVLVSAQVAQRNQLNNGDIVEVAIGHDKVEGPVWIMPGQAERTITLQLGYGRQHVGRVGKDVGFDAYPLRKSDELWARKGAKITKLASTSLLNIVSTQPHHHLHSPDREVYRQGTLADFVKNPDFIKTSVEPITPDKTLYEPKLYPYDGYKWGMSIDLTTCIGCNACMIACNIENNVPVVGKEQVLRQREMYWIRIDSYFKGPIENPEYNYMPVPCMHCEHAPCELVCPVEAAVHDHEGLNLQVYNRCVGTRFCSNNCPYKVRRFNFLRYSPYDVSWMEPRYNPEVTVRWRGVMEKCTYCVQRIAAGRITAEKENRRIRDGEVRTACQEACPADAIVFGDLNDPDSKIARLKQHKLDYSMLGLLNTRPRTTYMAKLKNPNPEMPGQTPVEETEYENKLD